LLLRVRGSPRLSRVVLDHLVLPHPPRVHRTQGRVAHAIIGRRLHLLLVAVCLKSLPRARSPAARAESTLPAAAHSEKRKESTGRVAPREANPTPGEGVGAAVQLR
jgi:hypothetical protein